MGTFLAWTPETMTEEQLVTLNNIPIYHSLETHNFWMKRYGRCCYCELGSKPVPKACIEEMNHVG